MEKLSLAVSQFVNHNAVFCLLVCGHDNQMSIVMAAALALN